MTNHETRESRGGGALDRAASALREEDIPEAAVHAAAARVRAVLHGTAAGEAVPEVCAGVQLDLAPHRAGRLAEPRRLLVEDHLRECSACRVRSERPDSARVVALPWTGRIERSRPSSRVLPRGAVAATVLFATAAGFFARDVLFQGAAGPQLAVQAVSGGLYRISAGDQASLVPGAEVGPDEKVRTARDGNAVVRLTDGSTVEMDERAELAVDTKGSDTTVTLGRGNIIVQAAKRRTGHLRIDAEDLRIAVTGTVFSVSRGVAGSRVSVLEGEVRVAHAGREVVLRAGDQFSTTPGARRVEVRDEVGWSRHKAQHLALLAAVAGLQRDLRSVALPGLRYESRLLSLLPESTVVVVALPNYGQALGEAYRLFQERLSTTASMREAWSRSGLGREQAKLDEAVAALREIAGHLGDEVVIAVPSGGSRPRPILLAELRSPGIEEVLARALPKGKSGEPVLRFVSPESPGGDATGGHLIAAVSGDVLIVAESPAALREIVAAQVSGGGRFAGSTFGRRVLEAYRYGAGTVFAADVERLLSRAGERRSLEHSGLADARFLVVERKDVGGRGEQHAELTFTGPRHGVASWLAAPGPMGALRFVSPNAAGAAAFVIKRPELVLDDLARMVTRDGSGRSPAGATSRLDAATRDDIARSLGGEIALALDGPVLPSPSWKLIVEVYDPALLQATLSRLVHGVEEELGRTGRTVKLDQEQVGDVTYQVVRAGGKGAPFEVHYAFIDGYAVVTPSRALLARAIETHRSGRDLGQSSQLTSLLPAGAPPYASGLLYHNLSSSLGALTEALGGSGAGKVVSPEALAELAASAQPSLCTLYGEESGIRQASTGAPLGLDVGSLMLPSLLERALHGSHRPAQP